MVLRNSNCDHNLLDFELVLALRRVRRLERLSRNSREGAVLTCRNCLRFPENKMLNFVSISRTSRRNAHSR